MSSAQIRIDLGGVQETLLWPLYCRAAEAARSDAVLRDARAIELVDSIDYAFAERFGDPDVVFALRAACFDAAVRDFLVENPKGTVVALGDGLETQFWRVDNGSVTWLSIDLDVPTALRRKLLPDDERNRAMACSALDTSWFDSVDPSDGVFITAQGLFMYLEGSEVFELIRRCSEQFPGASMMFDAVPKWLTRSSRSGTRLSRMMMRGRSDENSYVLPPMRWAMSVDTIRRRLLDLPGVASTEIRSFPPGRGFSMGTLYPAAVTAPLVRKICPSNVLVTFGS